ncbi:hypothetical protein UFOVP54_7 [uncultured Caudovirales phage]|uniref:Uncharacterized protein n=1 Tax=uncultured Caudovirales phage TaxID=2100421 RepID=A0A6J5KTS8_9CAUD|nr:hypothetical protein UFOVP54_7 [uncultured Caudovirales phage]
MSKNSAKRNYQSLMEFIPTLNRPKQVVEQSATKFSKADHYKSKGA